MFSRLHFITLIILSIILHALLIVAVVLLPESPEKESVFPVEIVRLPPPDNVKPPPLKPRPAPPPRPAHPPAPPAPAAPKEIIPEKPLPPSEVPMPKKFGDGDEVTQPETKQGEDRPEDGQESKETEKEADIPSVPKQKGPLPFLSQNDIDQLARKGMPQKKPGDDSVTLDTNEFKFISYNRWLKIRVESILKYPELAAVSGYQGTLFIKFDILKDGSLGEVEVMKSSGYKILDDEAVRTIRAAAPFQPLPEQWDLDRYSIRAAVIFYLGAGYIR